MIRLIIDNNTNKEYIDDIGLKLLGEDRILHFTHIIGNYWEERKIGLDTQSLFREMLRLFKKKKIVKQLMNDGRDKAVRYLIKKDIETILSVFNKKARRLVAINPYNKELYLQTVCCEKSSVIIEEDSECVVKFKGETYENIVEGRRAIIGQFTSSYDDGEDFPTIKTLRVYNSFTRKTFWRTTGRTSVVTSSRSS